MPHMTALPDPQAWQGMLDRHGAAFGNLRSGSRIGIGRRSDLSRDGASIVVWEARRGRLYAEYKPFCGYGDKTLDVMLVGDDAAVDEVAEHLDQEGLPVLKEQVRQGGFVCFLMRAQCDLIEAGYEDVLQSMGVVFMGACR
jgi:hypothetical protein